MYFAKPSVSVTAGWYWHNRQQRHPLGKDGSRADSGMDTQWNYSIHSIMLYTLREVELCWIRHFFWKVVCPICF